MDWRKISIDSRRAFHRHRTAIIVFLLFIAVFLALYPGIASLTSEIISDPEFPKNLLFDQPSVVSGVIRDAIYSIAVIVAGVWTYYIFMRGRTLKPRMRIIISFVAMAGSNNDIAVVRIRTTNVSNVRIRPIAIQVTFCFGQYGSERVEFKRFDFLDNVLSQYYDPQERCHLEPKDDMNFDVTTYVGDSKLNNDGKAISPRLLLVKVLLVDGKLRAWKENCILTLTGS